MAMTGGVPMAENASPLPAPNEKLLRIFDTEQETEAMVVRGLLESAGIDCQLGDSENSPDVLPFGGIGLLCARRMLNRHVKSSPSTSVLLHRSRRKKLISMRRP